MSMMAVECPHCGLRRDVPAEKVPDRTVTATCPRCKGSFEFRKSAAVPPAPSTRTESPPASASPLPAEPASSPTGENAAEGTSSGRSAIPPHFPPPPERPKPRIPAPQPDLPEIGELFGETWDLFRRRWLLLTGLFLLAAVCSVLPFALVAGGLAWLAKQGASVETLHSVLLILLAGIVAVMVFFKLSAALISAAADEETGFREAVATGSSSWIPLLWVSSLYGFIAGGAFLLFFIPGIVVSVLFFASPYIAVAGDARGMDALMASRSIVRGRFWGVFLRLLLVWLLAAVVGAVPLVGPLLEILMVPFTLLYHLILYRSLKESAEGVGLPGTSGAKAGWFLLGLAGYVLVPVAVLSFVGLSFFGDFLPLVRSGAWQMQGRQVITIPPPSGEPPSASLPAPDAAGQSPVPSGDTGSGGMQPSITIGPVTGPDASAGLKETDVSVFIYAVNAPGRVRVNGQVFEVIKSEPDMQYNINAFGRHFRTGSNTIEFDVTPTPVPGRGLSPSVHMKVSQGGRVLGEWRLSDRDGWPRSVTVEIPAGASQ